MLAVLIIGEAAAIGDRVTGKSAAKDDKRAGAKDSAAPNSSVVGEGAVGECQHLDEAAVEAYPATMAGAIAGNGAGSDLHRARGGNSTAITSLGRVGGEGAAGDR